MRSPLPGTSTLVDPAWHVAVCGSNLNGSLYTRRTTQESPTAPNSFQQLSALVLGTYLNCVNCGLDLFENLLLTLSGIRMGCGA